MRSIKKDKDYMSNKFVVDCSSFYLQSYSHTRVQTYPYKCSSVYFVLTTCTPFCPINTYERLFYKVSLIYISRLHQEDSIALRSLPASTHCWYFLCSCRIFYKRTEYRCSISPRSIPGYRIYQ